MTPYYKDDFATIFHADCREVLPQIGPVAAVVTDPPFNVGKDYGTHQDALSDGEYLDLIRAVARAAEVQAWVTPTVQLSTFTSVLGPDAHPVIVRRGAQGPLRFGWSDQFLLVLVRGRPSRPVANLWDGVRLPDEGYYYHEPTFGHPGTTSLGVMQRLVDLLVPADGVVLEPFLGTGTTLRAAKNIGRRSIGIEIDEHWCEVAATRLAQEVLDFGGVA